MDFATLFLFCFISLVIGAVLMLIIQYYIYVRFCDMPGVTAEQKRFNEKYGLPEDIRENAAKFDPESKSPLMALNLLMQFLFHELKNTAHIRKWLYRKLSLELDELVQKNPTGKLFDKLTLKDLNLGDHFPEVKLLRVHDVNINQDEGRIENLDIIMQINYSGNFRMAVDADLVLGKKASLNLTVKRLIGMARLQFTRTPYTHWSLSFVGDPEMDLGIESKFQGRQMQSNISAIISNQIRRTVRRKHTLPKYKIRLKPFFYKIDEEMESVDIEPNGYLEVKICELSRLNIPHANITDVYCTLTVGPWPWVEVKQKDEFNILLTLDIEIHKAKNQQIGIMFKQAATSVEIEAILPNTPAIKSKLRAGDTLVSIEGLRTHSIQQVARIIRSHNQSVVALRIERTIAGCIENDIITEDADAVYEDLGESKSSLGSQVSVHSVDQFLKPVSSTSSPTSLRQRRHNSSSDSSISNTPTNSPKKAKLIAKAIKKTLTRDGSEHQSSSADDVSLRHMRTKSDDSSSVTAVPPSTPVEPQVKKYQQHSTINYSMNCLISIDDLCRFALDPRTRYLNLCVYGRADGRSTLLGFLNIPIKNIIGECLETSMIEAVRTFHLLPPNKPDIKSHPLAGLKNFNQSLCYGDIVMTFAWDGNPNQIDTIKKSPKPKNPEKSECEPDKSEITPKTHNFIRTHFQRATQCDYCGKKIWLKDAVQCHDCAMICHKKCVIKCQNSTVCGPVDLSSMQSEISAFQPEFTFTEAPPLLNADETDDEPPHFVDEHPVMPESSHRPSLTSLISQGLKRVNSVNSLAIPGGSSPMGQNSRSLPQSPQHSPRKQSLVNQGVAPFLAVTRYLESIPNDLVQLTNEQIDSITEPIISIGRDEDVMTMAKDASKDLFGELSASNRVEKINELLTKLRLALDSETANHSKLLETNPHENSIIKSTSAATDSSRSTDSDGHPESDTPSGTTLSKEALARRAFDLGKSEERVQALSVIMLYLCTGLQHAQGVASQ